MRKLQIGIGALTIALAIASPSAAQGRGRGHGHEQPKPPKVDATTGHQAPVHDAVVIDRDGHIRVIREYEAAGSLPPGLAKRQALPPGLRKQLHENGTLPPGLQKRLTPVPQPLIVRLPVVPSYYTRYFAGNDLLVVDTRTNRVAVIIPNVWR
jgi:hypothetical protein